MIGFRPNGELKMRNLLKPPISVAIIADTNCYISART